MFLHFWESLTMSLGFYDYTPSISRCQTLGKQPFEAFLCLRIAVLIFLLLRFLKTKRETGYFCFFVPEDVTRILHHLHLMKTSFWSFCLRITAIDFTFVRSLESLSHTFLFDCLFLLLLLVWRGRRGTRRRWGKLLKTK